MAVSRFYVGQLVEHLGVEGLLALLAEELEHPIELPGLLVGALGGQAVEAEAPQMPAVIVDVVLAPDLAVGGNVDPDLDLVADRLVRGLGS